MAEERKSVADLAKVFGAKVNLKPVAPPLPKKDAGKDDQKKSQLGAPAPAKPAANNWFTKGKE